MIRSMPAPIPPLPGSACPRLGRPRRARRCSWSSRSRTLRSSTPVRGRPTARWSECGCGRSASVHAVALRLVEVEATWRTETTSGGWSSLHWWRRRESNPGPRRIPSAFVHVRSRLDPSDRVRRFGDDLASPFLDCSIGGVLEQPSLRVDALPLPRLSHGWTALRFLRPRERLRCRSQLVRPALKMRRAAHHTQTDFQTPRRSRSPP